MNKLVVLMLLVCSFIVNASEKQTSQSINIHVKDFIGSPLANLTFPAIFVWDEKQKPMYFHAGKSNYESAITNIIEGNKENIDDIAAFEFIKNYIAKNQDWVSGDKVIVFTSFDKSVGDCQPCEVADTFINEHEATLNAKFQTINLAVTNN